MTSLSAIVTEPATADHHRLAFEHSRQPNLITKLNRNIIAANKAACSLLGYTEEELQGMVLKQVFNVKDPVFKKMLADRKLHGRAEAQVTITNGKGLQTVCKVSSVIFPDENGRKMAITTFTDMTGALLLQEKIDIKKEKIVAKDIATAKTKQEKIDVRKDKIVADDIMRALQKSETVLAKNTEWIRYIAKTSYDVMWDWNIGTGEIYVGDSLAETFGYESPTNHIHFTDLLGCLLPKDKIAVQKKLQRTLAGSKKLWQDAFMIIRQNGSLAASISRASIIRDETGKAIRLIGATQDISRLDEMEKELSLQVTSRNAEAESFKLTSGLSYDGIWEWNIAPDEFYLDEGFKKLFGYPTGTKNQKGKNNWMQYLHPDDKEIVDASIRKTLASGARQWGSACRFMRADGSLLNVYGRAGIIRDTEGSAIRMIGVIHNLSRQNELEEKLAMDIELREQEISNAIRDARDTERSEIGKELHDNVNQLLSASKLYLEMAKNGGKNADMYLGRSSEYTLTAIEEIRKLTKGLSTDVIRNLGLEVAIENLCRDMMEVSALVIIRDTKSFREPGFNDIFKHNVFRIVQEQLTNIIKHARAQRVSVSLRQNKDSVLLLISDNGVGFKSEGLRKGMGQANITSRAAAYNGVVDIVSEPGKGCVLSVKFPITALIEKTKARG